MSETNFVYHELESDIKKILSVPDPAPEFVSRLRYDLVSKAATQTPMKNSRVRYRTAWKVSLISLVAILLIMFAINPQGVIAAVRSLIGYIPGIGFVDSSAHIFLLDEPVTVQREGITLSVLQGAADKQHTVILYQVEGLSRAAANSQGENVVTGSLELLRLPDGTTFKPLMGGGGGWAIGYQQRLEYPPLPAGVNEATLVVPVLQSMPAGAAPENWEIPLHFVPAPEDMLMMPVYEFSLPENSTATESLQQTDQPIPPAPTDSMPSNIDQEKGFQFSLQKVVELENSYLFLGNLSWDASEKVSFAWNDSFILTDANQNVIPVEIVPPDGGSQENTETAYSWAVQTNSKEFPGPLTLTVPSLLVDKNPKTSFQIDLGTAPEIGQVWEFSREIDIDGHIVILSFVSLYQGNAGQTWLEFTFKVPPDVLGIEVWDPNNHSEMIAGKGGGPNENGDLRIAFTYDHIPSGVLDIDVNGYEIRLEGPWQVSWEPPADTNQTPADSSAQEDVCLTSEKWEQIEGLSPRELPDHLDGQLLLSMPGEQPLPILSLASLDGSQVQEIAAGTWPSLSPDASRLAFSRGDGIYLTEINTGNTFHMTATKESDEYPIWSPDGNWIAFVRIPEESIYRIHPDGTGLEKIYQNPDIVNISAWLPDQRRIVYEAFAQEGAVICTVNIETGAVEELVQTENRKPSSDFALGPSGGKIAYSDHLFGQSTRGIFISQTGVSPNRLIASVTNRVIRTGSWHPNGEWLAISIYDEQGMNAVPVLVKPDTCEIIPLTNLHGEVIAWLTEDLP